MPKINTAQKLIGFITTLTLVFLNVTSYYSGEVADLVSHNFTAPYITPAIDWVSQWTVIITLVVIILVLIFGVVVYIRNHKKPDKVSEEVKAINELSQRLKDSDIALIREIKGMREDFKNRGTENGHNTEQK